MSTGPKILLCTACNLPLGRCNCGPDDEPVEGDLVTEDYLTFYRNEARRRGPVVTVEPGKSWRVALLCWMYHNKDYPNVFLARPNGGWELLVLALDGDDAD